MKQLIVIAFASVAFAACYSKTQEVKKMTTDTAGQALKAKRLTDTTGYTTIKWIDSVVNIGLVSTGKTAEINFRFKNTGDKPLFVVDARPGCGCTIADYPKQAIAPGKEGIIKANYDVKAGTKGEFRKNIHVKTNTKDKRDTYIFFFGKVKTEGDT